MKTRIVVAMSGGVDSSVAAAMLVHEGHEVIGVTIITHRTEDGTERSERENTCCSLDGIQDARSVAATFGFPHFVLDFSGRFGREVIARFTADYLAGRTPNPCVTCNRTIKWEELLRKADALGAERIATGHYAVLRRHPESGRLCIARGRDAAKDQSYALWALTQESLARTVFPLGDLRKEEVRMLGERLGVPMTSRPESQELCFVRDNDYGRFLREQDPGLGARTAGGEIILDGEVVGRHRGYPFYTIGQRKGLGVFRAEPLYVIGIDAASNRVEVGREEQLYRRSLVARQVNMQKYPNLADSRRVRACIRYQDRGAPALAESLADGTLRVLFDEPRRAITPGQSVVLYDEDDVVGGGVIEEALGT